MEGYGYRPILVTGGFDARTRPCTSVSRRPRRGARRHRAIRRRGGTERPQWPMIVLRTPKGWTGPKEVDGLPVEGTLALAPGADRRPAREPGAPERSSRSGCGRYRPEELFDEQGAPLPELLALPPEGDKRMSANPHANGGELLRDLALPDFRDYAVEVDQPGTTLSEATRVLGGFLRDVIERNPDRLPALRARTRPPRTGSPTSSRPPTAPGTPSVEPTDEHLAPRRPGDRGAERAPLPGLARGLPADRQARSLQLLRGLHPHRRLDVQPARQVAEGDAGHPLAPPDRVAQLPALLARLAAGPQRVLAPGPGLHRPRREQEGGDHPRLSAA